MQDAGRQSEVAEVAGVTEADQVAEVEVSVPSSISPSTPADIYHDGRRLLALILALALGAWLLRALSGVLVLFAVVVLVAMALNAPVTALERRGFKRAPVAAILVLSLLGAGGTLAWVGTPPVLREMNALVARAPGYEASIRRQSRRWQENYPFLKRSLPTEDEWIATLQAQAGAAVQWLLRSTFSMLGALVGGFVAILLLVFVLGHPRPIIAGFLRLVPERQRDPARRTLSRFMGQVTAWIKATLLVGAITGLSTALLLHFLGVQPAPVFGALAFVGEFVPNLGPVVASIPALFVALGHGTNTALWTLGAILFVQQIETNILVPLIMGRQMEMHPATIIFFALAMGALLGVAGAFLAVPAAALTNILVDEFYLRPRREEKRLDEAHIQSQSNAVLHGQADSSSA